MNTRNTPAGTVHRIDTQRARHRARPAPRAATGRATEADLDARIDEHKAAAEESIGVLLTRRARAEREALARRAGLRGDLSGYTDSQLDELDAIAHAAEEGRKPFSLLPAGLLLVAVAAVALILALAIGS